MLSIIIVNWNTLQFTRRCLESIEENTNSLQYELIVIDNASTDGSPDFLRSLPGITLICNDHNAGFAEACNAGIDAAKGDVILLLNSDTVLIGNALQTAYNTLTARPATGMLGCRLVNPDGSLQLSCAHFTTVWNPLLGRAPVPAIRRKWFRNYTDRHDTTYSAEQHQHAFSPDWIMGAFMMVRRAAIAQAGKLDEEYFMYCEDMDWCYRIRKVGWGIDYDPATVVIHYGGSSSRMVPLKTVDRMMRSRMRFMRKLHSKAYAMLYAMAFLLSIGIELPVCAVGSISSARFRPQLSLAFHRAVFLIKNMLSS